MEGDKSKENRRGKSRRKGGRKENERQREAERTRNPKCEEFAPLSRCSADEDPAERTAGVPETFLDLESSDNGGEDNPTSSFMCPALRRQLQTHKNILRLLHEHKLVSTQINGQRILSIQPIRWSGPTPGIECEIFVGRIPKTIYEDTLYPLFKVIGEVFQIRLMVDMAELTRGYCFIMYTNPEDATRAIIQLDQYEITPGKKIRVLASVNNCKLYVGPLPWYIASEEVVRVIYASAWDIQYVSIYRFLNHDAAYAIVSFRSHRNAALARRKLRPERLFKCNEVHVEWARVDWNPSNVYEDRGTVDDKGDVQITRNYLQPKRAAPPASAPTQKGGDSSGVRCRKQISPISPPNGGNARANLTNGQSNNNNNNIRGKSTRYSTMLTMAAALDDFSSPCDKRPGVITDINDNNMQLLVDEHGIHFKDVGAGNNRAHWTDSAADSYPSFDMWNYNLVPQLPGSPTNTGGGGGSLEMEGYDESPENKTSFKLPCDWEGGNAGYSPAKIPLFNGYSSSDADLPDYRQLYHPFHSQADHERLPIAVDAVRYQTPLAVHQNHHSPSCYVLLQPQQQSYLYPPEPATMVDRVRDGGGRRDQLQTGGAPPRSAIYDQRSSHWCGNGRLACGGHGSAVATAIPSTTGVVAGKLVTGDWQSRRTAITSSAADFPSPNYVMNVVRPPNLSYPISAARNPTAVPSVASENAWPSSSWSRFVSPCDASSANFDNDEKRPRPILKRAIGGGRVQL